MNDKPEDYCNPTSLGLINTVIVINDLHLTSDEDTSEGLDFSGQPSVQHAHTLYLYTVQLQYRDIVHSIIHAVLTVVMATSHV